MNLSTRSKTRFSVFVGDQPGESLNPAGIFAGMSGNDAAGPKAIADLIDDTVTFRSLGSAFRIYSYPIANPGSFETQPPFKQGGP